jgi:DNA-binding NtrC family response regulator
MLKILLALQHTPPALTSLLAEHSVDVVETNHSVVASVSQGNYHLLLMDKNAETVLNVKSADPRVEVILICQHDEEGVEAIKDGAFAFLRMPADIARLHALICEIGEMFESRHEMALLEEQLDQKYTFSGIVGRNPKILDVISFVRRIAPYYKIVTITGETGTGKEVIAKALHTLSTRSEDPFVTSNCGGFVETLLESELFGHRKGSFTGAINDRMGLFEAAREGTLFLDEIGDLPLSFQPHLLRVLQNGEYRPVGSHQSLHSRCRIIAATGKNLKEEVRNGNFREDLFYRITPLVIHLPPLRDRKDDIPLLSRFLLRQYNRETGKSIRGISRAAQEVLLSHNWPGNVRELENVINQAVILAAESFIKPSHFPSYLTGPRVKAAQESTSLDKIIKSHVETVLEECRNNRSWAAKKLGISRRALLRKIEKYSIKK